MVTSSTRPSSRSVRKFAEGDVGRLALLLAQHGHQQEDHDEDDDPEGHVLVELLVHECSRLRAIEGYRGMPSSRCGPATPSPLEVMPSIAGWFAEPHPRPRALLSLSRTATPAAPADPRPPQTRKTLSLSLGSLAKRLLLHPDPSESRAVLPFTPQANPSGKLDFAARRRSRPDGEEVRYAAKMHPTEVASSPELEKGPSHESSRQRLGQIPPSSGLDEQLVSLPAQASRSLRIHEDAQPFTVPSLCFGKIGDGPEHLWVEILRQLGQPAMAQAISRVAEIEIGGVFAPAQPPLPGIVEDFGPGDIE